MGSRRAPWFVAWTAAASRRALRAPATPARPWGRHIIRCFVAHGREYQLHATKGWRSRRA
jgi:hypothetical protein